MGLLPKIDENRLVSREDWDDLDRWKSGDVRGPVIEYVRDMEDVVFARLWFLPPVGTVLLSILTDCVS